MIHTIWIYEIAYLSCRLVGLVLQIVDLNCIALEYSFLIYLPLFPLLSSFSIGLLHLSPGSLGQHKQIYLRNLGCALRFTNSCFIPNTKIPNITTINDEFPLLTTQKRFFVNLTPLKVKNQAQCQLSSHTGTSGVRRKPTPPALPLVSACMTFAPT